jgi:branched-chain amino acid transport system substrate-binding protein
MASPLKVGILNDLSAGPPSGTGIERWLRLAVDELIGAGRIDREVEFVNGWGIGLPYGTAAAVERAFADLIGQGVLVIVGPSVGDNALVATPLAERHRVPTLNWAGSERARGDYMFHLQVGSHEDESIIIANHLAALGVERVCVVYDRSPIGRRHYHFFQTEAEVVGLRIAAASSISPISQHCASVVDLALEAKPHALVYLGFGLAARAVAKALSGRGWTGPRLMNTAGMHGYQSDVAEIFEGWTYLDMHSDHNRTLAALRERLGMASDRTYKAATGYDLGRLLAEGLARAPELTRDGVKDGLEQVKWLPAAEGYEGTLLGFGVQDRGGLHGRYLVFRRWLGGRSTEE